MIETDKSKLNKKKKVAKSESKPRPRGAKRTFLDELEERENRIREAEEREREREREIEAERNRNKPEEKEEDVVYIDVPTIFGDALSVKVTITSHFCFCVPLTAKPFSSAATAAAVAAACAPTLFSALVGLKWSVVFVCVCERGEEDAAAEAVDRLAGRRCMVCIAI